MFENYSKQSLKKNKHKCNNDVSALSGRLWVALWIKRKENKHLSRFMHISPHTAHITALKAQRSNPTFALVDMFKPATKSVNVDNSKND